jgi:SAM-dependent methyltransferase
MSVLENLQFHLLTTISPRPPTGCSGAAYVGKSKLRVLFGPDFFSRLDGKVVIDFGCGDGHDSIEIANSGTSRVIGVDIREQLLERARNHAEAAGLSHRCRFTTAPCEEADVIVSVDAFEHFADPATILHTMRTFVRPGGEALICFGPTWYHPLGGHLFSVFPWAHLVFSERALLRWRATFKTDGAKRFGEVAGGLNQMTIARFEELVHESAWQFADCELVPIRKLRLLHTTFTREWTTAVVRCRLVPR